MVLTARLHGLRAGAEGSNGDRHLCRKRGGDNNQNEITKPLW